MTESDQRPSAGYEPCEECGAAMDPQQRYCVNCAARRGNGANPSSRYFAAMSAKARKPLVAAKKDKAAPTSRAAAVGFFALLPIAVALGVIVGRGGSDGSDSDALLQALRAQEATASTAPTAGATAAATGAKVKAKPKSKKEEVKAEGKVTTTENGDVHEVTHFKASKEKEAEDTKLVEENPEQVGDDYIKAQQNLPDVVVVGGDGGAGAEQRSGTMSRLTDLVRRPATKLRRKEESKPAPKQASAPAPDKPNIKELTAQRDRLLEKFTVMQADLGGAFYEMAIRDHVRLDVLTRKAADLQRVDAELTAAERVLDVERSDAAGHCPSCGSPFAHGVRFCAQCGSSLSAPVEAAPAPAAAPPTPPAPPVPPAAPPAEAPTQEVPTTRAESAP